MYMKIALDESVLDEPTVLTASTASEAGASEAGASEAGASEAGASEAGASEAGASEVGASEVGASEAGASEVGASEAGASVTEAKVIAESVTEAKVIDYTLEDRTELLDLLGQNPGVIIIKFHADWCKPCKRITAHVHALFELMPREVLCLNMNIDDNIDLFAYLKRMKMLRGIPAIFAYYKGNVAYVPDHSISGTNLGEISTFFATCVARLQ
jgi:thiol-disulfide isomerase/thioredoxin